MGKHDEKMTRAAHIKRHTVGTSNEISFSVLDAAKNALDGEKGLDDEKHGPRFGGIALFTLPRKKKAIATPTKEKGLPLSTGDFVTVDSEAGAPSPLPVSSTAAARSAAGATLGLPGRGGTGLGVSGGTDGTAVQGLGGLGGVGASWPAPADEVARRKSSRKRRRVLVYSLAVVVVVALVAAAGLWLWKGYQTHQTHVGELDQALAQIEGTDGTLAPLNHAITQLIALPGGTVADDDLAATLASFEDRLPQTLVELQAAESLALAALDGMSDSVDKEAANQAIQAIQARKAMVDAGGQIAADASAAAAAAASAQEAWDLLLKADALAREAALLVVETTDDNVNASLAKTNEALDLFHQADGAFSQAAAYAAADFSSYRDYLAKRVEAMGYALAADEAFLAKNKEETIAQNDAYNKADAEAAALAADLSDDPARLVADASASTTADVRNAYTTACSQAAAADAFLRDYLGTTSK